MRHFEALTLDYVLQQNPFLLVDANAFIFHYPKEIHQKLHSRQLSLPEKKRLVKADESLIVLFYQEWFRILDRYSNLYLTNDVLDLELGGYALLDEQGKNHYRRKYQKAPFPTGSLLRSFDTPLVQECKRELWKRLERCRINALVKSQKPGLREAIRCFLKKQFTGKYSEYQALSRIDEELVTNALVFSLLAPKDKAGSILTNDVLISNLLWDLPIFFQTEGGQERPPSLDQEWLQLSKIPVSSYYWYRPPKREILLLYLRQKKVAPFFKPNPKKLD